MHDACIDRRPSRVHTYMHTARHTTLYSANYPMLCSSGDNTHCKTLRAEEVVCVCVKCFSHPLCPSFFTQLQLCYPAFFLCVAFFSTSSVKLAIWVRAKWPSVPQRELQLQLPIWQQCPSCPCAESKLPVSAIPFLSSITCLPFTCFAFPKAHRDCSDTATMVSQPGNNPNTL